MRFTPKLLVLALAGSLAHAQTLNIQQSAQPLAQSLQQLARQAGITLIVDSHLLQGKQAPALQGSFGWQAAMQQLLQGSGLSMQVDGNTVTLRRQAAGSSTLPSIKVSGQQAPGAAGGYLPQTSRSSNKSRIALSESVQAVSVVNRQQLDDQRPATIADAVSYTPGVSTYPTALTDDDVLLRGFGASKDGMYRDGLRLYHNAFISRSEPYGLEQIEVLRGPASVLYGRAAPGGLVNMQSKLPRADLRNELIVESGNHGHRQLAADIGGQLDSEGQLHYRLTALMRDSDSQWQYLHDDRRYLAAALSWQPSTATRLDLLASYQQDRNGWAVPNQLVSPGSLGQPAATLNIQGPGSGHFKEGTTFGYQFSHQFSPELTLRQNLRYLDGENIRKEIRPLGLDKDGRTLSQRAWYRENREISLSADTQLEMKRQHGQVAHTLLAGVDWRKSQFHHPTSRQRRPSTQDLFQSQQLEPDWHGLPLLWDEHDTSRQLGIYLQDHVRLGQQWTVTAGLRHDQTEDDNNQLAAAVRLRDGASALTGRLGATYQAANGITPYLSYSTSFQALPGSDALSGARLKPESGKQWEAGVRYQPEHGQLMLSASVYELQRANVASLDRASGGYYQVGKQRARGLELEARARLNPQWDLNAALSHTDTRILQSTVAGEVGRSLEMVPDWQAALWSKYRFTGALQGLSAGLGVRYNAASQGGGNSRNDAYSVTDLLLAWEQGKWRTALNVSNLFDRRYHTLCDGSLCSRGFARQIKASVSHYW